MLQMTNGIISLQLLMAKKKRIYVDGELDEKIAAPAKVIGAGQARYGFIGIGSEAAAFDAAVGPYVGVQRSY